MEEYTIKDCRLDTEKHIKQVRDNITDIIANLIHRRITHDLSKLHEPEIDIFVKYTPKLKSTTYGSGEYKKYLKEMQVALDHHYKENRHHPEHFKNGIQGMDLVDLVEMLCDWKAATMRHDNGDILKSLEINRRRFNISTELYLIFENTIKNMGWQ